MHNPYQLHDDDPQLAAATHALDRAWHDAQWVIPERPTVERAKAAEMLMSNALKKYQHVGALDTEPLAIVRQRVRNHFGMSGGYL
jgi:hypothetical protein